MSRLCHRHWLQAACLLPCLAGVDSFSAQCQHHLAPLRSIHSLQSEQIVTKTSLVTHQHAHIRLERRIVFPHHSQRKLCLGSDERTVL